MLGVSDLKKSFAAYPGCSWVTDIVECVLDDVYDFLTDLFENVKTLISPRDSIALILDVSSNFEELKDVFSRSLSPPFDMETQALGILV